LEKVPALNQLEQLMFARLLALYPKASLISDLLQIYEGKFVVRAEVQVNSITRATGLACAETTGTGGRPSQKSSADGSVTR